MGLISNQFIADLQKYTEFKEVDRTNFRTELFKA